MVECLRMLLLDGALRLSAIVPESHGALVLRAAAALPPLAEFEVRFDVVLRSEAPPTNEEAIWASFLNPNEPIARKLASLAKHLLSEEELSGLLSRAAPTPAAVEGGFGFGAPGVHAASAAVSRAFHWQH